MGLLDSITKAQDKLNDLQNRANNAFNVQVAENPSEVFKASKPKPKVENPKSKDETPKQSRAAKQKNHKIQPGAAAQILAQRDSMIKNGFDEYEFIANSGCCEVCGKLNGQHFPISKLNIGVNAPPMHEGCRCSIAAYSDRSEYEKWLNSL